MLSQNGGIMTGSTAVKTDCICELIEPDKWEGKEMSWTDKAFVKDRVTSVLHVPINYGAKMNKNMALIQAAGAQPEHPLTLTDENSLWGADIYIAVSKDVPGAQMVKLSGTFLTKVFEGPYNKAGTWAEEMKAYMASKGRTMGKLYYFYTACPKCAKVFGKNYVVLFAQVQ